LQGSGQSKPRFGDFQPRGALDLGLRGGRHPRALLGGTTILGGLVHDAIPASRQNADRRCRFPLVRWKASPFAAWECQPLHLHSVRHLPGDRVTIWRPARHPAAGDGGLQSRTIPAARRHSSPVHSARLSSPQFVHLPSPDVALTKRRDYSVY
jgi:hypothetical protein